MSDLFFFFKLQHADLVAVCKLTVVACMQDLVPWPGIKPRPQALGARSLTHWTTREVPLSCLSFLFFFLSFCCCCYSPSIFGKFLSWKFELPSAVISGTKESWVGLPHVGTSNSMSRPLLLLAPSLLANLGFPSKQETGRTLSGESDQPRCNIFKVMKLIDFSEVFKRSFGEFAVDYFKVHRKLNTQERENNY